MIIDRLAYLRELIEKKQQKGEDVRDLKDEETDIMDAFFDHLARGRMCPEQKEF